MAPIHRPRLEHEALCAVGPTRDSPRTILPPGVVNKLSSDIARVMDAPDLRSALAKEGADRMSMTQPEFARFVVRESESAARIAKAAGITPQSLCLYRVLQEALQDVVKHSVSRQAHVSLNGQINTINLTVKDSGAGFDPHEAMRGAGLGLTSMKERLKVVGGQLSIHSQRGRGTTIHAVAPVSVPTKLQT